MVKTIYICDKCGQEIEDNVCKVYISNNAKEYHYQMCSRCANEVFDSIEKSKCDISKNFDSSILDNFTICPRPIELAKPKQNENAIWSDIELPSENNESVELPYCSDEKVTEDLEESLSNLKKAVQDCNNCIPNNKEQKENIEKDNFINFLDTLIDKLIR